MRPGIGLKGLDLLIEVLPRAKRVAAFFCADTSAECRGRPPPPAAQLKGVTFERIELRRPDDRE